MASWIRPLLWLLLVGLFIGALVGQILVPVIASDQGRLYPEVAGLVVPYSTAGILALVCFQVALVAVGRLLLMIDDDNIFTKDALRWVDAIIWCGAVAAVMCAGVGFHMAAVPGVGGPSALMLFMASVAGGGAFVLLMLVMRGLLQTAISHRSELAEVI